MIPVEVEVDVEVEAEAGRLYKRVREETESKVELTKKVLTTTSKNYLPKYTLVLVKVIVAVSSRLGRLYYS